MNSLIEQLLEELSEGQEIVIGLGRLGVYAALREVAGETLAFSYEWTADGQSNFDTKEDEMPYPGSSSERLNAAQFALGQLIDELPGVEFPDPELEARTAAWSATRNK